MLRDYLICISNPRAAAALGREPILTAWRSALQSATLEN